MRALRVKRKKVLAINAANKLKHLFLNKDITISAKTKPFKSFITPIFLYNSELWTLTNNIQRKVDSFQRRIIRTFLLNFRWPTIVKYEEIFTKTKLKPWLRKRRLIYLFQLSLLYIMLYKNSEDMVKYNETTIKKRTQHELE